LLYTVAAAAAARAVGVTLGIALHVLEIVAHHVDHLLAGEKIEETIGGENHELIGCCGGGIASGQ
jgi:hypothetical protein